MGTSESKIENVQEAENLDTCNSGVMHTPSQPIRRLEVDPRSPSVDIARTPIEVIKTPINLGPTTVTSSTKDPRSPTTDFERTPIVINASQKQPLSLHNKLLDKARMPDLVPTPIKANRSSKLTPLVDTPKIIDNTTPTNKRHSVVGLLETNIDFIETDLDVVIQNKSVNQGTDSFMTLETNTNYNVNLDTPKVDEDEEVIETPKPNVISEPTENDLASIDALNRKLTNLIYEDKVQAESPVRANIKKHRAPLHEQNPNSQLHTRPVLKVSDKPLKAPNSGSKIPVFRDRKFKTKINQQCENTPPRMVTKQSQWAAEESMII